MIPRRYWSPAFGAAVVLAVVSAGLMMRSLIGAIMLDPLPKPRATSVWEDSARISRPPRSSRELIAVAVEHNPFRPDRERPPARFRLPGERVSASDTAAAPTVVATVTLIGTAVIGQGGFAMCQRGIETPKLVRIGERIGDLTLHAVRQGRAVFRAKDGSPVELRVVRATPAAKAGT